MGLGFVSGSRSG